MIRSLIDDVRSERRPDQALSVNGLLQICNTALAGGSKPAVQQATNQDVQGVIKEAERAAAAKSAGNTAFQRAQYVAAVEHYTDALRWAPVLPSSPAALEAAKLHTNRALALIRLGGPKHAAAACEDCCAALELDPQSIKAHFRRAAALQLLGSWQAARLDGQAVLALARAAGDVGAQEEAQRLLDSINAAAGGAGAGHAGAGHAGAGHADACAVMAGASSSSSRESSGNLLAPHSYRSSGQLASAARVAVGSNEPPAGPSVQELDGLLAARAASAGEQPAGCTPPQLQVRYTPGDGRHVIAAAAIPAGASALHEWPAAAVLVKPLRRSHCWWCFQRLGLAPMHCHGCAQAVYCSAACRAADPHHRPGGYECGAPWTSLLPEQVVLATRLLAVQQGLVQSQGMQSQGAQQQGESERTAAPPAATGATGSNASGAGPVEAQLLCSLESHPQQADEEEQLLSAVLASLTAAVLLQLAAQQQQQQVPRASAQQLLHALGQVVANAIAIRPPLTSGPEDRLALAVYPGAALLNHSCDANCSMRFDGRRLTVRVVSPIAPQAQLTLCYGPQVGEMPTAVRQQLLQQQYGFTCRCTACSLPDRAAERSSCGLRCMRPSCSGAVLPPFALPEGIAARHAWAGDGRCSSCGSSATRDRLTAAAAQLQQAAELEQQACAALQGLQPNQLQQQQQQQQHYAALGALQPVLAMRQALLHPHNLLLGQTYHRLATAAAAAAGVLLPDPLEPLQLAGSCGGHGSGSSGGSSCGETLPAALQQACTLSSGAAAAAGVPPAERAALLSGAVDHAQASVDILLRHYPPRSTAVAAEQRLLAALLLALAAMPGSAKGGRAAAAAQVMELEAAAASTLALHFGL